MKDLLWKILKKHLCRDIIGIILNDFFCEKCFTITLYDRNYPYGKGEELGKFDSLEDAKDFVSNDVFSHTGEKITDSDFSETFLGGKLFSIGYSDCYSFYSITETFPKN